jgi:hypothetical protein
MILSLSKQQEESIIKNEIKNKIKKKTVYYHYIQYYGANVYHYFVYHSSEGKGCGYSRGRARENRLGTVENNPSRSNAELRRVVKDLFK